MESGAALCCGAQASHFDGLSCCGAQASRRWAGIWDLPRPGIEPVFPALAGGFLTTGPPGKPLDFFLSTFIEV